LLANTPPRNGAAFGAGTLGTLSTKAHAALGAGAIVLALALVPAIWGCDEGLSGWNVLVLGLMAGGSSSLGSAGGRWTGQRLVGILVTVMAVLLSLGILSAITAGTC
jgi:hypothetical protein